MSRHIGLWYEYLYFAFDNDPEFADELFVPYLLDYESEDDIALSTA